MCKGPSHRYKKQKFKKEKISKSIDHSHVTVLRAMLIFGPTGKGLLRQSLHVHKVSLEAPGPIRYREWIRMMRKQGHGSRFVRLRFLPYDSLSMEVSLEPLEDLRIPRITELTQDCNIGLNDRKRRTSLATLADESCHYDAWLGHSLGSPKFNVTGVLFFRIKSIHIGVGQTAWMWFFVFSWIWSFSCWSHISNFSDSGYACFTSVSQSIC